MSTQPDPSDVTIEVDCSGLLCPLPVYKAAIALDSLDHGALLRLVTTDPGALQDIPAMTRQRHDTLVSVVEGPEGQTFLIRKGKNS